MRRVESSISASRTGTHAAQVVVHGREEGLIGIRLRERQPYFAHGHLHLGTDLEQLQPDRVALRPAQAVPARPNRRKADMSTYATLDSHSRN